MKRFVKTTPDGVKDLLFGECSARRQTEAKLMELFRLSGYHEVITPSLEFYDIFSFDTSYIPMSEMYKLTDLNGRLLVLRPDITVPLARIAATHLKDAFPPLKLCYNLNVFRITPDLSGKRDEIAQCGAELIGVGGVKADLEIITTASAALRSICGSSRFEIGHVGFFNSLINELPLSEVQRNEIHALMQAKNYATLNDLLKPYNHLRAAKGLMRLPRMFGGAEVLAEAREFATDGGATETLDYLETVYGYMCELGLSDNVMIDLGVVPGNAYYTGIVFRSWHEGIGTPVLSGGRYDKLLGEFGHDMPATGFAVYIDEAAKRREREKGSAGNGYLVHCEKGFEAKAFGYAESLRENGEACSISVYEDLNKSAELADKTGETLVACGEEIRILRNGAYETLEDSADKGKD